MTTPAIERVHAARQAVLSALADAVADLEAGREAQAREAAQLTML